MERYFEEMALWDNLSKVHTVVLCSMDMAILWSCRVYQDFEKGTGTTVEK